MLPSNKVWTTIRNNHRYPLRKLMFYGQFGRLTAKHRAHSRENVRQEELLQLCALSIANMRDRKLHKVGPVTLVDLQDEAKPLEKRFVDPVSLCPASPTLWRCAM